MLVIAHRGASAYAPEHTFASWDLALAMGADYLEQDLQMTRDGVLVVVHDETLDRTACRSAGSASGRAGEAGRSQCRGQVIDRTLDELRDCDVGSWFNRAHPGRARAEFASERIRTLAEVFERYGERGSFYVETKNPEAAPGMEAALLDLLRQHGMRDAAVREWRVLIQSFSEPSLRLIRELDPALPLIQLVEDDVTPRGLERRLATIAEYAVGIGPSWRCLDQRVVAAARRLGLEVHPYTVNEPALMERLADMGVTGMFTDAPDVLLGMRPADEPRGHAATRSAAQRSQAG